jgi:hypothetical protein
MPKNTTSRMMENEVVFRKYNESIGQHFAELRRVAKEDDQESMFSMTDQPLQFYCECSDENCSQRVTIKPSIYKDIHKNRRIFVTVCGHETSSIEHTVVKKSDYCIIEKYKTPNPDVTELKDTPIDNT